MKVINKIFKSDSTFLLISQATTIFFSYLLVVFLARYYSIDDYGRYSFSLSIISWIELVLTVGFYNFIISFEVKNNKKRLRNILLLQITLSILLTFLLIFLSKPLAAFFKNNSIYIFFIVASFDLLPFALYSSSVAILNEMEKYKKQAFVYFFYGFFKFIFMTVISLLFKDIKITIIGMSFASLFTFIVGFIVLFLDKDFREIKNVQEERNNNFDLPALILIVVSIGILQNIDFWIFKYYSSNNADLGYYGIIANLSKSFYVLVSIIFYKIYVRFKKINSMIDIFKNKYIVKNFLIILGLTASYLFFVYIFMNLFITLFFGVRYQPVVDIAQSILPLQGIFFLSILFIQGIFYLQYKKVSLIMLILKCILFVFTSYLFQQLNIIILLQYSFMINICFDLFVLFTIFIYEKKNDKRK